MSRQITKRQLAIYHFIRDFFVANQRMPSYREIAEAFGIRSANGVTAHLRALERRGLLVHEPFSARALRLVGVRVVLVDEAPATTATRAG